MIIISKIISEGGACPYQVEAETNKGEKIYCRYRWGKLMVKLNNEVIFTKQIAEDQNDEEKIKEFINMGFNNEFINGQKEMYKRMREKNPNKIISFDGYFDIDKLKEATKEIIQWKRFQ